MPDPKTNDDSSSVSNAGSVVINDDASDATKLDTESVVNTGSFVDKEASPESPIPIKTKKKIKAAPQEASPENIEPKIDPIATLKSTKKSTQFLIQKKLTKESATGKFAHDVVDISRKVPKAGKEIKSNDYYIKEDEPNIASREVLAQELFRLFIPNHPKTQLVYKEETKQTFVASKGIAKFTPLQELYQKDPQALQKKLQDGTIKGLGHVMVLAKFLMERDLKLGNLVVDENNRVIKIDGDWCFTPIRYKEDPKQGNANDAYFDISETDIKRLPYCRDYQAHNWLDEVAEGTMRQNPILVNTGLMTSPQFREEVNEALLQILVMPKKYLSDFVDKYTPDLMQSLDLSVMIEKRQEMFYQAAMQNESFKNYLQTPAAAKKLDEFKQQMDQFKASGKDYLVPAKDTNVCHNLMDEKFSKMQAQAKSTMNMSIESTGTKMEIRKP